MDKMLMRVQKNKKKKAIDQQQQQAVGKIKKKPAAVKVVYISNPMKVKTSASEFRALVQELTGQDSDIMTLLHPSSSSSKFSKDNVQISVGGGHHQQQQQKQEQEQEEEVSVLPNYEIMNMINSTTTTTSTNTRSEMSHDESDLSFETFDDHDDAMLIMSDQILSNNFFQSAGASYMV